MSDSRSSTSAHTPSANARSSVPDGAFLSEFRS
jgi:hypothetical protein